MSNKRTKYVHKDSFIAFNCMPTAENAKKENLKGFDIKTK